MPEAPSQRRLLIAVMLLLIVVINYLDRSNISIVRLPLSPLLSFGMAWSEQEPVLRVKKWHHADTVLER
jgi:hypothetical protein